MRDIVVAQLSDLHIGPDSDPICAANMARFDSCLGRIASMRRQPDLMLLTGDLTEYGDNESFAIVLERAGKLGIPLRVAIGNHDVTLHSAHDIRRRFALSDDWLSAQAGSLQLRVVVADTAQTGLHGGVFEETRAKNLAKRLSEAPDTPTLLAIHHPPCAVGIDWLDPREDLSWPSVLAGVIKASPQIIGVVCGHVHVSAQTEFAGVRVCVAPAVAPQTHVELAQIDADTPDGRSLIELSPPGFVLHRFIDRSWTSLTVYCDAAQSLVSFEGKHAGLVRLTQELDR